MTWARAAVAAILACLVLGPIVASGASLTVSGPVLQSFSFEVDHTPPPPADVDLYVDVRTYAGMSRRSTGTTRLGPYTVPEGGKYFVGYDGSVRPCHEDAEGDAPRTGGPFPVTGDDHLLCVQHGDADGRTVTVRVGDDEQARTVVLAPDAQ